MHTLTGRLGGGFFAHPNESILSPHSRGDQVSDMVSQQVQVPGGPVPTLRGEAYGCTDSASSERWDVKRTEQIWLKPTKTLRYFCHRSKSLYNETNYLIKQTLDNEEENGKRRWLRYNELCYRLKESPNYRALPAQTAQQILKLLDRNWKAFFKAMKGWKNDPAKFKSMPRPPGYKPKNGKHLLIFTNQQLRLRGTRLKLPKKLGLEVKTRLPEGTNLREARILPKNSHYLLEIVYVKEVLLNARDRHRVAGIDLGVTNLVTVVTNFGVPPIMVPGGVAKSINQYYNKAMMRLWRSYAQQGFKTGRKLKQLSTKRERKLHDYFHKVSRFIVEWCERHAVGTLVIGYNGDWKQGMRLGKKVNQNFVYLPFSKLVRQLQYKAEEQGIHVFLQEESHTSKCSFLDLEPIEHQGNYLGCRKKRGLFESATGTLINADVNGAYNIIRKAFPNAFADGIEGVGLHPERCVLFS